MGLTARLRDRWIPWTAALVGATAAYAVAVALTGGFKVSGRRPPVQLAVVATAGYRRRHRCNRPVNCRQREDGCDFPKTRGWPGVAVYLPRRSRSLPRYGRSRLELDSEHSPTAVPIPTVMSSQARLLAQGRLTDTISLSRDYQWPDVEYTLDAAWIQEGPARRG